MNERKLCGALGGYQYCNRDCEEADADDLDRYGCTECGGDGGNSAGTGECPACGGNGSRDAHTTAWRLALSEDSDTELLGQLVGGVRAAAEHLGAAGHADGHLEDQHSEGDPRTPRTTR